MLIDTHAHLDMKPFAGDLDAVLSRAEEADIVHIVTVSIDNLALRRNLVIAESHKNVSVTTGIHCHEAASFSEEAWEEIARGAAHPTVVAVGETGLDFFRDYAPHKNQVDLFLRHIELARSSGKPLIIHSRSAEEETLDILERSGAAETGGVMHCFTGSVSAARRALDLGFYISVAGPLTYPRSLLPEIVREVPIERLVLETDCPYLAPQAWRGKRNEPAYVVETARAMAPLKGLTEEDVHRITTLNARTLFRLPGGEEDGEIAYPIRNSLYLNVTNRCSNRCVFCGREESPVVKGHNLRLAREPSAAEIVEAAGDISPFDEVVFCGYGEPLLRWDEVREAAAAFRKKGARVRINTNGQARLFLGRDILPEMEGIVDSLSVSLNTADAVQYARLCRPEGGEKAFEAVKEFIRLARRFVPEVTATAVTSPGVDIEACRRLAEEELGAHFRARAWNEVG
jgi:TatD DNase family protein